MPTPDHERQRAREEASAALERAERVAERGKKIADGWRQSREDNNYRAMLRMLVPQSQSGG